MNAAELLCSGTPGGFGGLSNEQELAQQCPQEFKKGNRWTQIVEISFVAGTKKTPLKFKTDDQALRVKQWECFKALLGTFDLSHQDKVAVAGWMLSEWTIVDDSKDSNKNRR